MTDDLEIREQLAAFVAGELDAAALDDWLEDVAWDRDQEPMRTFVATVLRLLAEFENGDWEPSELKARIAALNRFYWFALAPKDAPIVAGSNTLIECQTTPVGVAGTLHVAASV